MAIAQSKSFSSVPVSLVLEIQAEIFGMATRRKVSPTDLAIILHLISHDLCVDLGIEIDESQAPVRVAEGN